MRTRDFNRLWTQLISRHPETKNWTKAKMREEFNRMKESINDGRGKVLLTPQVRSIKAATRRQQVLLAIHNSTISEENSPPVELTSEASTVVSAPPTPIEPSTSSACLRQDMPQLNSDDNEDEISLNQLILNTKSKKQKSSPDRDRLPMNLINRHSKGRREIANQNNSVRKRRSKILKNNNQCSNNLKTYRFVLEYDPTNNIKIMPEKSANLLVEAHNNEMRPIDLTKKVADTVIENTSMCDDSLSAIDLTNATWKHSNVILSENELLNDENSIFNDKEIINIHMPSLESDCRLELINNEPVIEIDSSIGDSPYKAILDCFDDSVTEDPAQLIFSNAQLENDNKRSEVPGQCVDDIHNFGVEKDDNTNEIETIEQDNECSSDKNNTNVNETTIQVLNMSKLDPETSVVDVEKNFEDVHNVTIEQLEENTVINVTSTKRLEKQSLVKIVTEDDISKDDHTHRRHYIRSTEENVEMPAVLNIENPNNDLETNINEQRLTFDTLLEPDIDRPFSDVSTLAIRSPAESLSFSEGVATTDDYNLNEPRYESSSTETIKSLCSRKSEDILFYPLICEETEISKSRDFNTEQTTVNIANEQRTEQKSVDNKDDNMENLYQNDLNLLSYPEELDYELDEENNDILSVATSWDGSLDEDLSTPVKNKFEDNNIIEDTLSHPTEEIKKIPIIDATLSADQIVNTDRTPFRIPKLKQNDQKANTSTTKTNLLSQFENDTSASICVPNVPTFGRTRFTRNSLEEPKKLLDNIILRNADNLAPQPSVANIYIKHPLSTAALASDHAGLIHARRNSVPFVPQLRTQRFASATLNNSQSNLGLMCSKSQLSFPAAINNVRFPAAPVSVIPQPSINDKCVQIFGVFCFLHLDGRCNNSSQCGRSHELQSLGEIQNKLFRLDQTDLRHAYIFMCRSKLLYQKFFPSFAIVFSNRQQTECLLQMVSDCKLYPDCSVPFIKILYDLLVECGLNSVLACKQIMSRCLDPVTKRWPNLLNSLVSIIMATGWINFMEYIPEICECSDYKFPVQAMSTILDEALLQDDPNLTIRVTEMIMKISLDQYKDNMPKMKLLMMKLHNEYRGNSTEHQELNPDYMSLFRENF